MRACPERSRRDGFAAEAAPTHDENNSLIPDLIIFTSPVKPVLSIN